MGDPLGELGTVARGGGGGWATCKDRAPWSQPVLGQGERLPCVKTRCQKEGLDPAHLLSTLGLMGF